MISRGWYKKILLEADLRGWGGRGGGGVGGVEIFFPNAVKLTIIPSEILPFTGLSMTWIWFPTQQDTDDLTTTRMALGGFCWSIFNLKQMAADMLQAGNTAEPMTSGFDFQQNRTPMTWPRQKWHSETSVGPSLILNKWQQIYSKLETLQNQAKFMNLKNARGCCCCTCVQSASYSYSFILTSLSQVNHITPWLWIGCSCQTLYLQG